MGWARDLVAVKQVNSEMRTANKKHEYNFKIDSIKY